MNLFTRGILASVLVGLTCVAASAVEIAVELPPTSDVTMTIKAESIQRITGVAGVGGGVAVISSPKLEFSSPVTMSGSQYNVVPFAVGGVTSETVCRFFGFRTNIEMPAIQEYLMGNGVMSAIFAANSHQLYFGSNQFYWSRVTCAIQ